MTVTAQDTAGHQAAEHRTFTVDTGPPVVNLDNPPIGAITTNEATIAFTSPNLGVTFECRVDGGDWEACASPLVLQDLDEGEHTVEIRAVNPLGENGDPQVITFAVDTTAPVVTFTGGPDGPTTLDTPHLHVHR